MKIKKKGISLIVLIVTIIVIIILAAAVILTISKNNPIESAKEAKFKEDVRNFQDDLVMSISKDYTSKQGQRDDKFNATSFSDMQKYIPSFTSKYEGKFKIVDDELVYIKTDEDEYTWCKDLGINIEIPPNPITDWEYSLDDTTSTITLTRYIGTSETVVVSETYTVDEKDYTVKFGDVNYTGESSIGMAHYKGIFTDYHGYADYKFDGTEVVTLILPDSMETLPDQLIKGCNKLKSLKLPSKLKTISDYQFDFCSNLECVVIPNGVTSIGRRAFGYCSSLANITIPNSVTNIGDSAFDSCSSLTDITIPNSVINIGECVFVNCSSLTNITIPNSVTNIASLTFAKCSSLANITIPDSVTSIDENAFEECSSLTNIYFKGTTSQWNNISKDNSWNNGSSITTITCTDGTITL